MPDSPVYDVIVLGAGISGLAAARILSMEGLKTVVLEARCRNGGRIHTVRLPVEFNGKKGTIAIDLGASYLHGCSNSQDAQPLFRLADRLKMPTTTAPGDVLGSHRGWECPEVATWRDSNTGETIDLSDVAEMSFLLDRCLVYMLMSKCPQSKQGSKRTDRRTLSSGLSRALNASLKLLHDAGQRKTTTLSTRERAIFDSLLARYIAFVNPPHRLPLKLSLGPHYDADVATGSARNPDQPSASAKRMYVDWLERKRAHLEVHGPKIAVTRRVEHQWEDRLVLQGFDKFIEFLADGIEIKNCCVVRRVDWQEITSSTKPCTEQKKQPLIHVEVSHAPGVDNSKPTYAARRNTLQRFSARYCLVTVPVGVLKGLDRRSSIVFTPNLPACKRDAIHRLAIPRFGAETHNKVVLQFRPQDVFWDRYSAQLVCPGARLHILNADFFGLPGLLVAHLWAGSALRLSPNRSDALVVQELLDILGGMYRDHRPLPYPIYTQVTRWSEDPFSLGAYTTGEVGSGDADRHAYASSLPSSERPVLLFAGEGTVDSSGGQQCTHGAFSSGVTKAIEILEHFHDGSRSRLRDVRIIDYMTGGSRRQPHYPRHSMVRRAMKRQLTMPTDISMPGSHRSQKEANGYSDHYEVTAQTSSQTEQAAQTAPQTMFQSYPTGVAKGSDHVNLCRRSSRPSTWASSQASVSLFNFRQRHTIENVYTKDCSNKSGYHQGVSSLSNTSIVSLKEDEDLTSSSSPLVISSPELDSDAEDQDTYSADQHYHQQTFAASKKQHICLAAPPPTNQLACSPRVTAKKNAQLQNEQHLMLLPTGLIPTRPSADIRFGSPPVFRPPLPPRIVGGSSRRDPNPQLWSHTRATTPAFGSLAFPGTTFNSVNTRTTQLGNSVE